MNKRIIGSGVATIVVLAATAAIASYATRESIESSPIKTEQAVIEHHTQAHQEQRLASTEPARQPVQHTAANPPCDDKNIVGTVGGAAAGGLVGSQIGHGTGKTVAVIGGVLGGGYLGNQYIPTRNVSCR